MKLNEIKNTPKSTAIQIKELEHYLSMKDRVVGGGNALSPGERKDIAAAKKELVRLKKQLKEADETTDDVPPAEDTDLADQSPTPKEVATDDADAGTDPTPDAPVEDVGSVSQAEGFKKSKKEMFAFGATRPVTLLTKDEKIGGMDITLQYVINPKTGAWSLRAALQGQDAEDMVEFETGEDPTSLIKNLKKKKKITPHQLVDNLNPPADKIGNKKPPAPVPTSTPAMPDEDEEDQDVTEAVKKFTIDEFISTLDAHTDEANYELHDGQTDKSASFDISTSRASGELKIKLTDVLTANISVKNKNGSDKTTLTFPLSKSVKDIVEKIDEEVGHMVHNL